MLELGGGASLRAAVYKRQSLCQASSSKGICVIVTNGYDVSCRVEGTGEVLLLVSEVVESEKSCMAANCGDDHLLPSISGHTNMLSGVSRTDGRHAVTSVAGRTSAGSAHHQPSAFCAIASPSDREQHELQNSNVACRYRSIWTTYGVK